MIRKKWDYWPKGRDRRRLKPAIFARVSLDSGKESDQRCPNAGCNPRCPETASSERVSIEKTENGIGDPNSRVNLRCPGAVIFGRALADSGSERDQRNPGRGGDLRRLKSAICDQVSIDSETKIDQWPPNKSWNIRRPEKHRLEAGSDRSGNRGGRGCSGIELRSTPHRPPIGHFSPGSDRF